jgi:hypothetical protein
MLVRKAIFGLFVCVALVSVASRWICSGSVAQVDAHQITSSDRAPASIPASIPEPSVSANSGLSALIPAETAQSNAQFSGAVFKEQFDRIVTLRDLEESDTHRVNSIAERELSWARLSALPADNHQRKTYIEAVADLYIETGDDVDQTIRGIVSALENYPDQEMRSILVERFLEHYPGRKDDMIDSLKQESVDPGEISASYKDS